MRSFFPRTKLLPPQLRHDYILRPRLDNLIEKRVVTHQFTLVAAPAGYGKTLAGQTAASLEPERAFGLLVNEILDHLPEPFALIVDDLHILILGVGGAPHLLWLLALIYACLGLTMFTISSFWKVSLHMVSVSGFSTVLVYVFGPGAWWAFLSLPLVAWARLYRKKHTPAQLLAGAIGGILITAAVFTWAG
ncbi:MAG: hypothetical protein ACE5F6_09920 [Anaerolineae bacterium]